MALGVVLFLPAKEQLQVFNSAQHEDDKGTERADDEHPFENTHQYDDEYRTHTHTMLFETGPVDQFPKKLKLAERLALSPPSLS
jgi:hypothetical protein